MKTTPERLRAMGYTVDPKDWPNAGYGVATKNGKIVTAAEIITELLDGRIGARPNSILTPPSQPEMMRSR